LYGLGARVVQAINQSNTAVFSVDMPSGLFGELIVEKEKVVQNAHVISFQRPKLSFFFPEHKNYIKSWHVVDIGLDETFIQSQASNYYILDTSTVKLVQSRPKQSHKGSYGHALIIAGSYGKIGAAILSSRACLRSGVGLLTTHVPEIAYQIMQISVPEAMCSADIHTNYNTHLPEINNFNAIAIGPGLGKEDKTVEMFEKLLKMSKYPLVIDADAINILSEHNHLIALLPKQSILTPHIKEFDRLVGSSTSTLQRYDKLKTFAKQNNCIVVLKDAYTCIASNQKAMYINTSGNQGMATGGSGDVLTGIITGLLAQHYDPLSAALIGVYFHGKAGDDALENRCHTSLIASDIIAHLKIASDA